jgi:tetratricopeptide (TPR) repeat protein
MNSKKVLIICTLGLLLACNHSNNSETFMKKTSGRYLYNADEIVEVYFNESTLYLKWRGAQEIKPLKIDDSTFFVKEMNEKIRFSTNATNGKSEMIFVPKTQNDSIQFAFRKLAIGEKIPSEYLEANEFNKALTAYLTIQQNDSLDSAIDEKNFNKLGYQALRDKDFKKALNIFNINIALYPSSANVYDSYADALKQSGDTLQAIEYYKKSLAIDSGNQRAKKFIEQYE